MFFICVTRLIVKTRATPLAARRAFSIYVMATLSLLQSSRLFKARSTIFAGGFHFLAPKVENEQIALQGRICKWIEVWYFKRKALQMMFKCPLIVTAGRSVCSSQPSYQNWQPRTNCFETSKVNSNLRLISAAKVDPNLHLLDFNMSDNWKDEPYKTEIKLPIPGKFWIYPKKRRKKHKMYFFTLFHVIMAENPNNKIVDGTNWL